MILGDDGPFRLGLFPDGTALRLAAGAVLVAAAAFLVAHSGPRTENGADDEYHHERQDEDCHHVHSESPDGSEYAYNKSLLKECAYF